MVCSGVYIILFDLHIERVGFKSGEAKESPFLYVKTPSKGSDYIFMLEYCQMQTFSVNEWEACSINPPPRNKNRVAGWHCLWSGSPSLSQTWSGLQWSQQIQYVTMEEWLISPGALSGSGALHAAVCSGDAQDNGHSGYSKVYRCPDSRGPFCLLVRSSGLGSVRVFR